MQLNRPLRFQPIFQDYLWGGTRLSEFLHKPTGPGIWAESWELVDHPRGQSIVREGPWEGWSLRRLLIEHGPQLVGAEIWERINSADSPPHLRGRFPLLFKFLDARQDLSVQVHPDDNAARRLEPPDLGKTEAWYVLQADPGAKIFAGLRPGVTAADLRDAVRANRLLELLHTISASAGQTLLLPAGTIHALGAGLLIAEIQQASDATFRLWDWGRTGADGLPRPLHVEQALAVTRFDLDPIVPQPANQEVTRQTVAVCPYFSMVRQVLREPTRWELAGRFQFLAVVEGAVRFGDVDLNRGETIFLPAAMDSIEVTPLTASAVLLEIQTP